MLDAQARFWAKVKPAGPDECWEWQATKTAGGYGRFNSGHDTYWMAHRYAYVTMVGDIPNGLELDHLCRNRACVNPSHLEPVTRRENVRRGISPTAQLIDATHCTRGHEFTPENTRWRVLRGARCRCCRTCLRVSNREAQARYRAKQKV